MQKLVPIEPIDYLVLGHITQDRTPTGLKPGGTATYAALTARAMGLRPGIITASAEMPDIPELSGIPVITHLAEFTTTFENEQTPSGRVQHLYQRASDLNLSHVPETWRTAPIVHIGPVAQEIDPKIVRGFPDALIGITPQGWLRDWDRDGLVHFTEWPEATFVLRQATICVLSIEDVNGFEHIIDEMLSSIRILVVTEGAAGARLYWNGDLRYFRPPPVKEVDPTGSGDIFAAAFFIRYSQTRDPWEAARFATQLAAISVTRPGLAGIPTPEEVQKHLVEVLP